MKRFHRVWFQKENGMMVSSLQPEDYDMSFTNGEDILFVRMAHDGICVELVDKAGSSEYEKFWPPEIFADIAKWIKDNPRSEE